jgi:hypothetical protein
MLLIHFSNQIWHLWRNRISDGKLFTKKLNSRFYGITANDYYVGGSNSGGENGVKASIGSIIQTNQTKILNDENGTLELKSERAGVDEE